MHADAPVESLIPRLARDKPGALLVVGEGRLVGIVTRADVLGLHRGGARRAMPEPLADCSELAAQLLVSACNSCYDTEGQFLNRPAAIRGILVSVTQTGHRIPQGVIERLPQYLNVLLHLRGEGRQTVSSATLSELSDVNAAQIRRDLAYFGSFGKRGVGYDISLLVDRIQRILGSDHAHRIAIVGAGNLGSAIASYDGLRDRGFVVAAIFDNDPRKVGQRVSAI